VSVQLNYVALYAP